MTLLGRLFGPWLFSLIAGGIAAGYYVCCPGRVAASARFYRALFPGRGRIFYLGCAWRQFQSFTSVFLDRSRLQAPGAVSYRFAGREHLLEALQRKTGGILLMSHIGNWEVGARLLRDDIPDLRLMLYMGQQAKDQIERLQKQDLAASGIRVIAVDRNGGSPFDLVEGISFLKAGGFISMAGDVVWHPDQRVVEAGFLGHTVRLPEAPHMLALASGAPLFIFFATHSGRGQYLFSVLPPTRVKADTRAQRRQAVLGSVQAYADQIARQVRRAPFEWYHFHPFLGPELKKKGEESL